MSTLSSTTVVSARSDLLATQLSDTELVMLDAEKGRYFGVEHVANTIWQTIAEPHTVEQVCQVVLDTYDAERGAVEADTLSFLTELVDAGLAECHDGDD